MVYFVNNLLRVLSVIYKVSITVTITRVTSKTDLSGKVGDEQAFDRRGKSRGKITFCKNSRDLVLFYFFKRKNRSLTRTYNEDKNTLRYMYF